MSIKGLIGVALICTTAIVVVLIQTGPRAVYWQSLLGTHYGGEPTRIEMRGPNGEIIVFDKSGAGRPVDRSREPPAESPRWIDQVIGRSSGVIEYDRTTLVLGIWGHGPTPNTAMRDLSAKRRRLESEIRAAGYDNLGFAELEVRTDQSRGNRNATRARLEVSFEEGVDVLTLLSRPQFRDLATVSEVSYHHSDIIGAIAGLKQAALDRARERAAATFEGSDWNVESVVYKFERTRLARKSKYRLVHVSVAAVLQVRGTGSRVVSR